MKEEVIIRLPIDVARLKCLKKYAKHRQENFLVITLDGQHKVIKVHRVTLGLASKTITHPRECYYPAIKDNAVAVIFAHNHPSGGTIASTEDIELTERLCKAAKILGFHVLDHVILTADGEGIKVSSIREEGRANFDTDWQ